MLSTLFLPCRLFPFYCLFSCLINRKTCTGSDEGDSLLYFAPTSWFLWEMQYVGLAKTFSPMLRFKTQKCSVSNAFSGSLNRGIFGAKGTTWNGKTFVYFQLYWTANSKSPALLKGMLTVKVFLTGYSFSDSCLSWKYLFLKPVSMPPLAFCQLCI